MSQTPQLSFALNNPDAPNTVYITADVTQNSLTLTLVASATVNLSAGTLVPIGQVTASSGSLLYLDLSGLGLTPAEFSALSLVTDGWSYALYPDSGQMIGFTPTAALPLAPGTTISLALGNFAMATAPSSPTVDLDVIYFNIGNIPPLGVPYTGSFGVAVTYPPDDNDKDLPTTIAANLTPNEVVNSIDGYPPVQNTLVLQFGPGPQPIRVTADKDTEFTLSFVYASDTNGFGALLTVAQAQALQVTAGVNASGWTITPNLNAQSPYWTLKPPAGQPVIGTGVHSTVSFNIANLITNFQPGPTLALVGYSSVPGYKSGAYSIILEKDPHVAISTLTVTPAQSVLDNGVADVRLQWSSSSATQLTLQPVGQDVTGLTYFDATIAETTQFTLLAEGQRPGNVDNTAYASVTAFVLPVINDFTATPAAIYQGDFPANVALAWNVNTPGQVQLSSSATGPDPNLYAAIGTVTKSLGVPQMLTLTALQQSGVTPVSCSVIVPGFALASAATNNSLTGAGTAAPAAADFVAMAVPGANQVAILSTATFQPFATVNTGSNPVSIAFSPDGTVMYVANQGDGTVSVIGISNIANTPPYQFSTLATVTLGGAPQQIITGADGSAWVTIDAGANNGLLAHIQASGGRYTSTSIGVGVHPRGLAVTPSNGLVFVANSGSNSVSVIGNGIAGLVANTPLTGLTAPQAVGMSPDGGTALVTCSGTSTAVVINVAYYATAPRKTYTLQDVPGQIAMFTGGNYAVIAGASTAILLNYQTGTTTSTKLPAAPAGVCVTPDNGMALLSIPSQTGIEVITFANYAQVSGPAACNGAVTGVAVTPDNGTLLVWYNSNITIQGNVPAPMYGVALYDIASGTVTPALGSTGISDLAISPAPADDAFYVAPMNSNAVTVYKTSTQAPFATITLPAKTGASNRQPKALALSADGKTVFILSNDGSNKISILAYTANISQASFTLLADVSIFQSAYPMLTYMLAAAPDGSAAYAVDSVGGTFYAIEQTSGSYQPASSSIRFVAGSVPTAMTLLPDGSTAYVLCQYGSANVFCVVDLAAWTMNPVYLPDGQGALDLAAITALPDGTRLLGAETLYAGIRILDSTSLQIIQTISWSSAVKMPYGIAVSSDGSRIFTANAGSGNVAIAEQVQPLS